MTERGHTVAARAAMAVIPLVVLAPLAIVASGDRYNARRVLEMVWAGLVVVTLFAPSVRDGAWRRWRALSAPTRWATLGFIGWSALSSAVSVAPGYAFREWGLGTLVLAALLPLAVLWRGREEEVRLTLAVTLLTYGIITVVQPEIHGFAHPRFQGQLLAVATPVLLFAGDATLAVFAAPALAGGMLNGSRALVAALVGVHVVALVAWRERRRRMLPALAATGLAVAIVVVLGLMSGVTDEMAGAAVRGASDNGRLSAWAEVLRRVGGSPLLGVGPGLTALYPGIDNWAGHPHNVVMTVLGETGVGGLLLATVVVVQFTRLALGAPAPLRPWVLAIVAGLGHGQLSGTFVMPGSQVMLLVAAGVLMAETAPAHTAAGSAEAEEPVLAGGGTAAHNPTGRADRGNRRGWLIVGVALVAVAVLAATLHLPTVRPGSTGTWAPRFWLPGAIPR